MDKRMQWGAWLVYALVVGAGIARGGMWLDEMQVWCLGRDHATVIDLLRGLRNEGHPPLWFLLVHGLTRVFASPTSMAVLHGLFALGTAWIVLFRAPWPLAWRVVAVFGYYLVFEYAIIARNYGPASFFLFSALAAHRAKRPWLTMLAFMALAMTHYWGMVVAGAWAVVHLVARDSDRTERLRQGVVLLTVAVAFFLAWPSAPLPYTPDVHRAELSRLPDQLGEILGQVFVPFPDLAQERPWNKSWLLEHHHTLNAVLGFACFGLGLWCVAKDRRWLLFYLLAAGGILAFPVFAPFRSMRYYGPLLMALLAALWMAPPVLQKWKGRVVLALLLVQVPGAVAMTVVSQRMPRSMADRFVHWYTTSAYRDLPVMVHPCQEAPAISGYLGRPVYCPATGQEESYCRWIVSPFRLEHPALAAALARSPGERSLLVADAADLASLSDAHVRLTEVQAFPGAQIGSESYHVYLLIRTENGP